MHPWRSLWNAAPLEILKPPHDSLLTKF
jgi:hypothetical protein